MVCADGRKVCSTVTCTHAVKNNRKIGGINFVRSVSFSARNLGTIIELSEQSCQERTLNLNSMGAIPNHSFPDFSLAGRKYELVFI